MKSIWNFFASIWLTIILAILICVDAAWGSLAAMKHPEFYRALDQEILLPWLMQNGAEYLPLTLWMFVLIFLVIIFTINTVVCTADKVYSIFRQKRPIQSLYPHIVHIGFLVALLGHLAGSAWGFKSNGNVLFKGEPKPVPHTSGLMVRLDDFEAKPSPSGDLESLKTRITLIKEDTGILTDDIEINGPVIYKGIAFYHFDQGETPSGLLLDVSGENVKVNFDSSFTASDGNTFKLGNIYPDFEMDEQGRPNSRSAEFVNPHIEIISESGITSYLDLTQPGSLVTLNGKIIRFEDFIISPYVVLAINKDPGIGLIIAGSIILVIGMVLLLFFRGERGELVRQKI